MRRNGLWCWLLGALLSCWCVGRALAGSSVGHQPYNSTVNTMGGVSAPNFSFVAPSAGDYATLTAATGQTISCSRATTATYIDNAGVRQTAAPNRCVVESVVTATGTPGVGGTPALRSEPPATNPLLNSTAPATQTTASLATGVYTGWMDGSGSLAFTVGTATATGLPCTATGAKSHDCHFTITGAGTITATVTGSVTAEQVEKNAERTSLVVTAGTTVTRASDSNTTPNAWNLVGPALSVAVTSQLEGLDGSLNQYFISTDVNYVARIARGGTNAVQSRDDSVATAIIVAASDASQLTMQKYSLSRSGNVGDISAGGTFGTPVALAAQAANPTVIYLGTLTSAFNATGIWIQSVCISATSATVCGP